MVYHIKAFQLSEFLSIKDFKNAYPEKPVTASSTELFYNVDANSYFYLFNYGVVVYAEFSPERILEFNERLKPYANNWLEIQYKESFIVEHDEETEFPEVLPDRLKLPLNLDQVSPIRLAMLQVAHSVALDYYEELTYSMLNETYKYTSQLEQKGRISISKKNLLKFVGKTLNIKNSIVDNLYILDDHGFVWDDHVLDVLNKKLKEAFDIQIRFRDIDYKLKIVEENLKMFTDLLQHRESSRLEWIIIILILIEVANMVWREVL